MKAILIVGAVWSGFWATTWAQEVERVYTDVEGREIRAVIEGVDSGFVFLKRGSKVYKFPMEKLNAADQEFAKEWAKDHVRYQLQVTAEPREDKSQERKSETGDREDDRRKESWSYEVAVTNRGGADISNLEAEYDIYIRRTDTSRVGGGSNRQEAPYLFSGKEKVKVLPSGKQTRIFCGPVDLMQRKWIEHRTQISFDSSGNSDTSTTDDKYSTTYELEGVKIKLYQPIDDADGGGKRLVLEWETEDSKVKKLDWSRANQVPRVTELMMNGGPIR
jgi:hypothetical protein